MPLSLLRLSVPLPVLFVFCGMVSVPRDAGAQPDPASAQRIVELNHRLEALERAMTTEIAAVRQQIADLQGPSPVPAPPVTAAQAESQRETFARDGESVARVNNQPPDPALAGFIAIPGTPARLKVDGYAKLDAIVDASPAGNTDQFFPSTIPIGLSDAQRTATSTMHVRQTRINLDFRSPTELGTDFRTFAEIDFFGPSGSLDPRMRHFYGQVANVLVGQTWTTFADPDALPDTLDDGAPGGLSKLRQAQLRYTQPLAAGHTLAFAIERPLTQTRQITDTGVAYSPAPDIVARYRFDASRGHIQAGSIFRTLGYRTAGRNTTKLGTGFNAAGVWKAPNDDVVAAYVVFGQGIGRYIENIAGTSSDLDLNDDGTDVAALPALGSYTAYTHFWPKGFRSTGVFGYTSVDTTAAQPGASFKDSYYVAANLLWNPIGSLNVGLEYLFGTHRQQDRREAHANRVQFAAKYDFFRKRPLSQ
jgi:hypothetical protein